MKQNTKLKKINKEKDYKDYAYVRDGIAICYNNLGILHKQQEKCAFFLIIDFKDSLKTILTPHSYSFIAIINVL